MARQRRYNLSKDESVDNYFYELARQRRYPSIDDSVDDYFYDKANLVSAYLSEEECGEILSVLRLRLTVSRYLSDELPHLIPI